MTYTVSSGTLNSSIPYLLTHIIVEVAKALGGSLKFASAKNCKGDDSTAQENTKEWGHKQIKRYK